MLCVLYIIIIDIAIHYLFTQHNNDVLSKKTMITIKSKYIIQNQTNSQMQAQLVRGPRHISIASSPTIWLSGVEGGGGVYFSKQYENN